MKTLFIIVFQAVLVTFLPASAIFGEDPLVGLLKKTMPAVVTVIGYDSGGKAIQFGSGFFINAKGHVVTNNHVIDGMTRLDIRTADGKKFPVTEILSKSKEFDLAELLPKLEKPPDFYLSISGRVPQVGEEIVAIGSPMGLEQTVSRGIISGMRKFRLDSLNGEPVLIYQINAPVSSGSSGGPVMDTEGRVLGVATFQFTKGQNLNFAVPAAYIADMSGDRPQSLPQTTGKLKHYINEKGSIVITK